MFPPTRPLEFYFTDIVGPLRKTRHGHEYLLVITHRHSKLTRVFPLRNITADSVSKAFYNHWVLAYGPLAFLLSEISQVFTSKHFQAVCSTLGIRNLFRATYPLHGNHGSARQKNVILCALRAYVMEHAHGWHRFDADSSQGFNTKAHGTIGLSPLDHPVSRPSGHLCTETAGSSGEQYHHLQREFFSASLKTNMSAARTTVKSQKTGKDGCPQTFRTAKANKKDDGQYSFTDRSLASIVVSNSNQRFYFCSVNNEWRPSDRGHESDRRNLHCRRHGKTPRKFDLCKRRCTCACTRYWA